MWRRQRDIGKLKAVVAAERGMDLAQQLRLSLPCEGGDSTITIIPYTKILGVARLSVI